MFDLLKSFSTPQQRLEKELDRIRGKIRELKDESAWIESAPVPKDEAAARIKDMVDTEARRLDRVTESLVRPEYRANAPFAMPGGILEAPVTVNPHEGRGFAIGTTRTDAGPLLAWLFGDALKERLLTDLEAMDYRPGPPLEERPALLEGIHEQLFELESEEEALIVQAEEVGLALARRTDADPAAIVEFDESAPGPKRREDDGSSEVQGFFGRPGLASPAMDAKPRGTGEWL